MMISKNSLVLFVLVVVPVLQSFLSKLGVGLYSSIFNNIDEIALLLVIDLAVIGCIRVFGDQTLKWFVVFFFGYLSFGVISSLVGGGEIRSVVFQIIISVKILYVLFVVIGTTDPVGLLGRYLNLAKVILVVSALLIAWQFILPSFYDLVFWAGAHKATMLFSGGVLARGAGVFTHPGQMAVFSASLTLCLFFLYFACEGGKRTNAGRWLFLSLMCLVSTFSRLEMASALVGIVASYLFVSADRGKMGRYLLVSVGLLVIVTIFYPALEFIYNQTAGDGVYSSKDPRVVFFVKGVEIANDYFPYGSGLGSYGGFVAAVNQSSIYISYGFEDFYWYLQGAFLADTFWAHILGESGYFGLMCYLLSLLVLVIYGVSSKKASNDATHMGRIVISLVVFVFLNSFATPDLVSVLSLGQCLVPVGALYYLRKCDA